MKVCVNCNHLSSNEEVKVFENLPVTNDKGQWLGYSELTLVGERCPYCGGIVEESRESDKRW